MNISLKFVRESFGFLWFILANIQVHEVINSSLSVFVTGPVLEFYSFGVFTKYSLP